MKIYTKTGDTGETGLFGGGRVNKDHLRIEAYGTIDELNAAIGLVRCEELTAELDGLLADIQNELFAVGAELAATNPAAAGTSYIDQSYIARLEAVIDAYDAQLPALKQFILPTGTRSAAAIHLARAICRRAERCVVSLSRRDSHAISEDIVVYLNRLGDLLFVLSRYANHAAGQPESPWQKPAE